jgi:hypothetical protein
MIIFGVLSTTTSPHLGLFHRDTYLEQQQAEKIEKIETEVREL